MMTRARPLLGTIVAIRADAAPRALEAAFAAVEQVQALMSFHSSSSDVARINREAHRRPVPVHPWTFSVLTQAHELGARTQGAFDVTRPGSGARYSDLLLHDDHTVELRAPARIDLGGIAKGFAVDMAVEALVRGGASSGCVNAGGDLRRFGDAHAPVRVRLPGDPARSVCLPPVTHDAFATSSSYFGSRVNDLQKGRQRRLDWSITIAARTCMLADALTKPVALLGPLGPLLTDFDALAFAVDRRGQLHAPAS